MPHALGDAARRAPAALLALALGCGPSLSTLAQQGQIPQAWARACARAGRVRVERDALTFPERAALRRAFAAETSAALTGRALSRQALNERLDATLFPSEMVLLQLRVSAPRHPGWGVHVDPTLIIGGQRWTVWEDRHLWTLAEIEPPTAGGFGGGFNLLGAFVDTIVGGLTLGGVDLGLRGTKEALPPFSPGNPGTGTTLQNQALFLLRETSRGCGSLRTANLLGPCEGTFVLSPKPSSDRVPIPISLDPEGPAAGGDALVLLVTHDADRHVQAVYDRAFCSIGYEVRAPLPPGPDVAARLQALFAAGPLSLAPPGSGSDDAARGRP